jgi:hypothetical protein
VIACSSVITLRFKIDSHLLCWCCQSMCFPMCSPEAGPLLNRYLCHSPGAGEQQVFTHSFLGLGLDSAMRAAASELLHHRAADGASQGALDQHQSSGAATQLSASSAGSGVARLAEPNAGDRQAAGAPAVPDPCVQSG